MYQALADDDEHKPRLQLEYSGSGPGSRGRTAIGCGESGGSFTPIDSDVLPNPPWWFGIVRLCSTFDYSSEFSRIPIPLAMEFLTKLQIPPLYRLALGFLWNFIDEERDNFSRDDLHAILIDRGLLHSSFDEEMKLIQKRCEFKIWQKLGAKVAVFGLADYETDLILRRNRLAEL